MRDQVSHPIRTTHKLNSSVCWMAS